jgi:hypothetical protein
MEYAADLSLKLLLISGIAAVLVLGYILSRAGSGSRPITLRHSATFNVDHVQVGGDVPNLLKDDMAEAEAQFHEAMQYADANAVVTMGRK